MKRTSSTKADHRRSLWVAGLALLFATGAPAQSRTPQQWLRAMTEAMRTTNYEGVFVYHYGEQLETMRIVHRADDNGERERLVSLNGVAREIIRNNTEVTCILPDTHAVMVDRRTVRNPLTDVLPDDAKSLSDVYSLSVEGKGRVAGRQAVRLGIRPTDDYRYGYRLWVDQEQGLLLRSDLLAGGGAVEQIMFTEISTPERIPDDWLEPKMPGEEFTWYRDGPDSENSSKRDAPGESPWRVTKLPDGFRQTLKERRSLPGRTVMVEHRLYSDGLATVSVYIEQTGDDSGAFHGRSRMGAINAYGRTVGDYQIVVVGEVPPVTVETIGRSITRDDPQP